MGAYPLRFESLVRPPSVRGTARSPGQVAGTRVGATSSNAADSLRQHRRDALQLVPEGAEVDCEAGNHR